MIQILKQRLLVDEKTGKNKTPMFDFRQRIKADSVQELFLNLEKYTETIPEEERFNLHYTLCECEDEKTPRVFKSQSVIPFDIDGIDIGRVDDYPSPILSAIGNINPNDVAVVHSGRGLHILIGTTKSIDSPDYFKRTRKYYKLICDRINRKLKQLNLPGHTDTAIWSAGHTLRLPGTYNIKTPETGYPNLNFKGDCKLVTRLINPIPELSIEELASGELLPDDAVINIESKFLNKLEGTIHPDSKGILEECEFIKWCKNNPDQVKEPQWRAMLSVTTRLKDGIALSHQFSEGHHEYDYEDCQEKIETVVTCTKPYTCGTIETLWDGCKECIHYKKTLSPVSIKSKHFIKTRDTGFRDVKKVKTGEDPKTGEDLYSIVPGKVNIADLVKYFEECHPFVTTESKNVYIYNGKHWEVKPDIFIKGFCQEHVNPGPTKGNRTEFLDTIIANNQCWSNWFNKTTYKKINLKNGVLDLSGETPVLHPHSKEYGFMNMLNYEYDPNAECPRFDQFMEEITLGRQDLHDVLLEFAGYAFSNDKCTHAKALILLGEGSNGKSTFLNVLKELAGEGAFSSLSAKFFNRETHLALLDGKLFNLAEETPTGAFVDSSEFKNIVSGGSVVIRKYYKDPYTTKLNAKLMMAANELPKTRDVTKGFLRRLLLVPFDAEFSNTTGNKDLKIEDKLFNELPGILNRIIEGYQRLCSQNQFTDSQTVREEIYSYRDSIDNIHNFVKDCLIVKDANSEESTPFYLIYNEYVKYCEQNKVKNPDENKVFSRKLKSYIKNYKQRLKRVGQRKVTTLTGVSLIAGDMDF